MTRKGHRKRPRSRGHRVDLDAVDYTTRTVIEHPFHQLNQRQEPVTRYHKHATIHHASDLTHTVIAWTQQLSDMA